MKIGKPHPTAPVIARRACIFAPSLKALQEFTWVSKTPWGTATVTGRLSQIHSGLLDAVCSLCLDWRDESNGARTFLIDPYRIAKATWSSRDYKWLNNKMDEMRVAKVQLEVNGGSLHIAGIVSEFEISPMTLPNPLGGSRHLYRVTLSSAWMQLFREGLVMDYAHVLPQIAALKSGAAQALARFVLTHEHSNWQLVVALTHIRALREGMPARTARHVMQQVREDAHGLEKIGIRIRNGVVFYDRTSVRMWREQGAATI